MTRTLRTTGGVALGAVVLASTLTGCSLTIGGGSTPSSSSPSPAPSSATPSPTPSATRAAATGSPSRSADPDWSDAFAAVSPAVTRIAVTTCDGRGSGSGFLVAPDEVMTAAHVVSGATSISLRFGADVHSADVVGLDETADLALLRVTGGAPRGPALRIADGAARVGQDVAALGYPLGQPLGMTRGAVTATSLRVEVEGRDRRDLLRTDAAINPGNSGGPLVLQDGSVVGVVSAGSEAAGDGYAVGRDAVARALATWGGGTPAAPATECSTSGADGDAEAEGVPVDVGVSSRSPEAPAIAQTMQLYAQSVNSGYYEVAWGLLTASMRGGDTQERFDAFAAGLDSSLWRSLDVVDVDSVDPVTDTALVRFRTTQDAAAGPSGQTCSDWTVRYTLVLDSGDWQIDGAANAPGSPRAC